jgi:uncharacterized protein YjcR
MSTTKTYVEIKPYNLTELAAIYGVTVRTMKNWITRHSDAVGEKMGRLYTALQVRIIFEKLGLPGKAED